MKLIIDIHDHIYSMVTNTGTFGCYRFNTSKAIRQGVPLDKIRTEITEEIEAYRMSDWEANDLLADGLQLALNIIDGAIEEGVNT